jgi:hypothetical protein
MQSLKAEHGTEEDTYIHLQLLNARSSSQKDANDRILSPS